MAQRRETSLRANQLAQDAHPPSTSNPPRSTTRRAPQTSQPFFHRLQTDVTALLRSILADILTLLRGRPSEIKALIHLRLSDLRALPLWEKLYWASGIIVYLLLCLQLMQYMPPPPSAIKRHCTSEWIFDTAAPYHTTNQQCAFADYNTARHYYEGHVPTKRFDSPATYKGVESHGYGTVKLDLQYANPATAAQNASSLKNNLDRRYALDKRYAYAPLELHFAQFVPEQANTISVSQLMKTNNGMIVANQAMIIAFESRDLGLKIGNETNIPAEKVNGHYVFKARVPSGACECPDANERELFISQTKGPDSHEFKLYELGLDVNNAMGAFVRACADSNGPCAHGH